MTDITTVLTNGHTPLRHDLTEGTVSFLCAEHVGDFEVKYESDKRVLREHHFGELATTQVRDGDVLLSIKGKVGNFALVENVTRPTNINQDVALIRFDRSLPIWWVLSFLNSQFGKLQVDQLTTGAINPFLGLSNVRKLKVPVFAEAMMHTVAESTALHVQAARTARARSERLLQRASEAIDIAIEQSEKAALDHVRSA